MISKILDNLTWISIFMIVGGVILALVGDTGTEHGIDFWGIKVSSSNGGVALAIVGGLLLLKPAMSALKSSSNLSNDTGLLYLTINVEDKVTGMGISGVNIVVDLLEGKRTFTTDRDGNATISFTASNKLTLKNTRMSVSANGYEPLRNKKLDLEGGKVNKVVLKRMSSDDDPVNPEIEPPISIKLAIQYLTLAKDHQAKEVLRQLIKDMSDSQKITVSGIINEYDKPNANFNIENWRERSISKLKSL